jgi:acyl carrier protein
MDETEILSRISDVASEHFNIPGLRLKRETVADDVHGWSSLTHIQLLLRIEETFGVRFRASEIGALANVGQLVDRVGAKLASREGAGL